jgi:hypothetical protein
MRWIYRERQFEKAEIEQAIKTSDGLRAGLAPVQSNGARFIWVRPTFGADGKIVACEKSHDCSSEETEILDDLLKGEIAFRLVRIGNGGTTWAIASLE